MPQMAPSNWFILNIYFILNSFNLISLIYFYPLFNIKNLNSWDISYKNKSFTLKW